MRDWKKIATGLGLAIPPEDLNQILPSLEKVDSDFRTLVSDIPLETEPAYVLLRNPEKPE